MCTCVIRVVDAKYSLTLFFEASRAMTSPSLCFTLEFTLTSGPRLPERRNGREYREELGHTIVLGLPSVYPNTYKKIVAHFYRLKGIGQRCGR